jgi:hypothetical protein
VSPLSRSLHSFLSWFVEQNLKMLILIGKGEIIMLDHHLVLYKSCYDVVIYLVAMSADENELMLSAVLNAFVDALNILLK